MLNQLLKKIQEKLKHPRQKNHPYLVNGKLKMVVRTNINVNLKQAKIGKINVSNDIFI
jgi:hypothetical protein